VATPFTGIASQFVPLGADSRVNALLVGSEWTSPSLSYSFVSFTSTFSTNAFNGYGPTTDTTSEPWSPRFALFTASVQTQAVSALAKWSAVANVNFTQVADSGNTAGDIRFAFTDVGNAQAEAYSPGIAAGGDVWFSYLERFHSFAEGSYNYMALVHEIGHTLGLKHPFDVNSNNSTVLPVSLDSQSYTVMSYSARAGDTTSTFSFDPTTPMVLDIQAIQYLYGANTSFNAGNTAYHFDDRSTYHQTIWDGGGLDTISYDGAIASVIDLRQGAGSTIGNPVFIVNTFGAHLSTVSNVWVANGAQIENASGGSGADRLTGNELSNHLSGGGGNDILTGNSGNDVVDGGSGSDLVVFTGAMSDYTVTFNAATGSYAVGDHNRARDGTDVVSTVEAFQFSDGTRTSAQLTLAAPVPADQAAVIGMSEALFGFGPGTVQFASAKTQVQDSSPSAFAMNLGASFSSTNNAELASKILVNIGITPQTLGGASGDSAYSALLDALTTIFGVYQDARGQVVLNLTGLLSALETNSVYGAAAAAFNNEVAADYSVLTTVALVGVA
jgi:serralysin